MKNQYLNNTFDPFFQSFSLKKKSEKKFHLILPYERGCLCACTHVYAGIYVCMCAGSYSCVVKELVFKPHHFGLRVLLYLQVDQRLVRKLREVYHVYAHGLC